MGEPALALARVLPGAWLRAVHAAAVSRGARRLAGLLASLPSFPHTFPSLKRLAKTLDPERPLSIDQVRRYVRELERAGLLNRHADFDRVEDGGDGRQTSNVYEHVVNVVPAHTNARGPLASCQGLRREKYKRSLSRSPGSPDLKAAAERVCVPARAASAPPPPRAGATTAAPRDRATEPEQRTGFAADLHAALASFSVLPEPPPTPAPEPTPPQAAQRPETPATRPEKLGMGARVHPEVAEALSRLPDGGDAVRVLAGAALTEDEQRSVLERVLTVHRGQGVQCAGAFIRGPIRDALVARDRKAETAAAEAHDYVPDGGPFPDALRAPPGHLEAKPQRRPPPPRDPLLDRLNHERHRLHHVMSATHPGRPAQAAIVAKLEADLARRAERRGLHLVT